ncbi:MAG: DUF2141 domain-containing protein [Methylobacterium mesophilicum]|nr:DUF2141 domain-containing protein [Methylobacterium mesophilicum]
MPLGFGLGLFASFAAFPAFAGSVTVAVEDLPSGSGTVGCALFDNPDNFPGQEGALETQTVAADASPVSCFFKNLPAGRYAVAVSHDENANGQQDTNFLGIPKEAWGVSNNVRPRFRAPRFEEAAFDLKRNEKVQIDISVAR